mgnify:CR=1 FL=1
MPFVQIRLWPGRSDEKKAEIIARVTDAVSESLPCPREAVTVLLEEHTKANWGIGGTPASQVFPD